ncbi:hypothetical protein BH09GEM1_BH09GEM1_22690 [soil metagenome]
MSAKHYTTTAHRDVGALGQRLRDFGFAFNVDSMIDVEDIASGVCDCEIVQVSELTEARAIEMLRDEFGVDTSDVAVACDAPLAGALCVAGDGALRWIFVRKEDSYERRRFSIAHEIGHLIIEVEPDISNRAALIHDTLVTGMDNEVRVFNRCAAIDQPSDLRTSTPKAKALSKTDLREIRAHHFAAELLMPFDGVTRLLRACAGATGIRTKADVDQLVRRVADTYVVSGAAARLRIEKDLRVVAINDHSNMDLF